MAEVWPSVWKSVYAANRTLAKIRAAARRAGTLCEFGIYDSYIPFSQSVAVLYQRAGRNQKLYPAVFDPSKWPSPRAWFEEKGKAIVALFHRLRAQPRDIKPLAGAGGVKIVDHLVRILRKVRYQLAADVKQHQVYAGTGRAGRFILSKDPKAMTAYDGSPGGITDAHSALPLELRMRALGLHDTERPQ